MTILNEFNNSIKSLGSWFNSNVIQPFGNKVLSPIANSITRPIKTIENIGEGTYNASVVWKERAGSLTNDVIKGVDNTFTGIGNLFNTPILPIALGLGAFYIIKK